MGTNNSYRANMADSLVWNIGYVKTMVELGIDPTEMLRSIYDKYVKDDEFKHALQSGEKFALKLHKEGNFKTRNHIKIVTYSGNTD